MNSVVNILPKSRKLYIYFSRVLFRIILFFYSKDFFLKGIAVPFIIVALLEFIVGYHSYRSSKDIIRVQTI
jgi:uncharacterized membrane protein